MSDEALEQLRSEQRRDGAASAWLWTKGALLAILVTAGVMIWDTPVAIHIWMPPILDGRGLT